MDENRRVCVDEEGRCTCKWMKKMARMEVARAGVDEIHGLFVEVD